MSGSELNSEAPVCSYIAGNADVASLSGYTREPSASSLEAINLLPG